MSDVGVDIVIVNWNSGVQLQNCIKSILDDEKNIHANIFVVDNGSTDESSIIPFNFSGKLLRMGENLGFGRACNIGGQQGRSDYLLFLNPDAALYAGSLEQSINFMSDAANKDVGICGVQLLDESGDVSRSCARFPTPAGFIVHAIGLDRIMPRLGHFMSEWAHDKTLEVDQVIGAFFLVRRQVYESLGGFDERFFVYFEEVDFSFRAQKAGWRSMYLADVQAYHAGGGTSNQVKARRLFYSLRSRLLYSFKHFSTLGAVVVLLVTLLLEPISRSTWSLMRHSWPSFRETWVGYGMLWRWLPQWVFKGVTR